MFTREHEWVYAEDDDIAVIGISEYAAGELGDIVYIELPEVGTSVKQTEQIGTIEAVKTVADLFSPISGEVVEINDEVVASPEIVNKSPHEDGWFFKMKMDDPSELDSLLSYDKYNEFLGEQEETHRVDTDMDEEDE
jgi:glycine cleavage system H protein